MKVQRIHVIGAAVGMVALVALSQTANASPATGFTPTTLGTGSLNAPVKSPPRRGQAHHKTGH